MLLHSTRLTLALLLFSSTFTLAHDSQQQNPPQQKPAPQPPASSPARSQFFAGSVTHLDKKSITVSRSFFGLGETKTFVINQETRVSGNLKLKTRVTVRYEHRQEGDVAIEIQTRPAKSTPPS